jgi:hypothetical protein
MIFCIFSHNNVPESVPADLRKQMQENIDGNKDDLVSKEIFNLQHFLRTAKKFTVSQHKDGFIVQFMF